MCDNHKDSYNKNVIVIEQYKSLNKNFSKLTTEGLSYNCYNMYVYNSDNCICEDIINKLHKPTWLTKLLITFKIHK